MPAIKTGHLEARDKTNLLAIDRYARADYYRHPISPGSFTGQGAFGGVVGNLSYIQFNDSGSQDAWYTFPRPELWHNGNFTLTLYYSFTTTSANTKRFVATLYGHPVGGTHGGGTSLYSETVLTVGHTADVILQKDIVNPAKTSPVIADYALLSLVMSHSGAHASDTSAANMRFYGGYLTYHPRGQQ